MRIFDKIKAVARKVEAFVTQSWEESRALAEAMVAAPAKSFFMFMGLGDNKAQTGVNTVVTIAATVLLGMVVLAKIKAALPTNIDANASSKINTAYTDFLDNLALFSLVVLVLVFVIIMSYIKGMRGRQGDGGR